MIYEIVKKLCDQKGMTIMALEKEAGLANGTVGGWRASTPMTSSLQKVARVLGVPVGVLLGEKVAD